MECKEHFNLEKTNHNASIDLTRMECKDIELVIGMLDAISIDLTRMECKG